MTLRKAASLASTILDGNPGGWDNTRLGHHLKLIWFGMVWENSQDDLSLKRLADHLGHTNHSTVYGWREAWRSMDWRSRHGWLIVFENAKAKPERFPEIYERMRWLKEEFDFAN
tara:strand:+ start:1412 stop:1753 length:342 start_codon:yes stop_codon:yes gene_type:complete